jgi:hypothetical protein
MTAVELIEVLRARGVTLEPHGDKLRVRPVSRLTAEELDCLRVAKTEVLALLAGPRPASPTDPAAGLSAPSVAAFAALGQIVSLRSRTLGGTVYLCPDAESVAELVEDRGLPRSRCYLPAELTSLAGLFRLEPPARAAALRMLDALREVFGEVDMVEVRPAPARPEPPAPYRPPYKGRTAHRTVRGTAHRGSR